MNIYLRYKPVEYVNVKINISALFANKYITFYVKITYTIDLKLVIVYCRSLTNRIISYVSIILLLSNTIKITQ